MLDESDLRLSLFRDWAFDACWLADEAVPPVPLCVAGVGIFTQLAQSFRERVSERGVWKSKGDSTALVFCMHDKYPHYARVPAKYNKAFRLSVSDLLFRCCAQRLFRLAKSFETVQALF